MQLQDLQLQDLPVQGFQLRDLPLKEFFFQSGRGAMAQYLSHRRLYIHGLYHLEGVSTTEDKQHGKDRIHRPW